MLDPSWRTDWLLQVRIGVQGPVEVCSLLASGSIQGFVQHCCSISLMQHFACKEECTQTRRPKMLGRLCDE